MKDWMSGNEVQRLLGISKPTYYRWVKEGKLRGTRAGRDWRFPRSAVEGLLCSGESAGELRCALEILAGALEHLGMSRKEVDAMRGRPDRNDGQGLMEMVLAHARRSRAGSLHLEPGPEGLTIRERIDGRLSSAAEPLPPAAGERLVRTIKEAAALDLDEVSRSASGRFFFPVQGRRLDIQATTYPTTMGESLTLVLLDPATAVPPLDRLGFDRAILRKTRELLSGRKGLFIVNGASGTGKTTTLYSLMLDLRRPDLKIMTAEDPVELRFEGIQQAQIDEAAGFGFKQAAIAMIRSDVDLAMLAELRDAETMRMAVQMAFNRRVLTVMHAQDGPSALWRYLQTSELPAHLICDALLGILDQRLAGRSCPGCAVREPLRPADARALGLEGREASRKAVYNRGCDRCRKSGVLGQLASCDLLVMDASLRRAIASATDLDGLRAALPSGRRTLRDDLLDKVAEGVVSPPEAIRVLK